MKILIIGGGNMGLTYAQSFIKAKILKPSDLMILERSEERKAILEKLGIASIYTNSASCLPYADLIVLAVKPQDTEALFKSIKPHLGKQQLFLSIMAGMKIESIQKGLNVEKIIRAMPNLPAQIGMGMTAYTSSEDVTRIELVTVQNLLNTTGKAIYTEDESLIDAATAISGSGPAYVYFFMNSMIEAAKKLGFSDSQAALLVGQTFMGAVHLQNRNKLSCKDWINKVASKGGTTEAALKIFTKELVDDDIQNAAFAAHKRAVELGNY